LDHFDFKMSIKYEEDDVTFMVKQMDDFHLNFAKLIVSVIDFTIKFFLNSVITQINSILKSITLSFLTIQLHIII
jgi:hypothetical protein